MKTNELKEARALLVTEQRQLVDLADTENGILPQKRQKSTKRLMWILMT